MSRVHVAVTALLVVCLGACAPRHNNYSSFATVPSAGWAYADNFEFMPRFNDSVATGRLVLAVRHSANYPYANLWVEISTPGNPLAGAASVKDTVNIRLCDSGGRWLGRGLGASLQKADTLPSVVTLADSVPVRLRHIMRVDTLDDIEQIGLIFVPD